MVPVPILKNQSVNLTKMYVVHTGTGTLRHITVDKLTNLSTIEFESTIELPLPVII